MTTPLRALAHARSGDKGNSANIGVIAYDTNSYQHLAKLLTEEKVFHYFKNLGLSSVTRYELPNLHAFNFILHGALQGGGSLSLRVDSQGKALGEAILEMPIETDIAIGESQ